MISVHDRSAWIKRTNERTNERAARAERGGAVFRVGAACRNNTQQRTI